VGGNPVWRKEFEHLASIAARKLGYTANKDANEYWLNRVREWIQQEGLDKYAAWLPTGTVNDRGSIGTTKNLYTERIAELSVMFCMELIARGIPESAVSPSSNQNRSQTPKVNQRSASRPLLNKYRSEIKRAILIQLTKNPRASDLEICRALDADGAAELPKTWKSTLGDRLFVHAYRDNSRRHLIEIAISRVRADLRKQGLLPGR
jgi:hypothetical protein